MTKCKKAFDKWMNERQRNGLCLWEHMTEEEQKVAETAWKAAWYAAIVNATDAVNLLKGENNDA